MKSNARPVEGQFYMGYNGELIMKLGKKTGKIDSEENVPEYAYAIFCGHIREYIVATFPERHGWVPISPRMAYKYKYLLFNTSK